MALLEKHDTADQSNLYIINANSHAKHLLRKKKTNPCEITPFQPCSSSEINPCETIPF